MISGSVFKRVPMFCLASFIILLMNGCAKTTQYDDVWENHLKGCSLNCHSPDGTESSGPDMSTQDKFYANVVGKTVDNDYPDWAATRTGDCNDVPLIKPGDADNSLVVASLIQSVAEAMAAANNCTSAINIHTTNNITSTKASLIDLIEWINDGAKQE